MSIRYKIKRRRRYYVQRKRCERCGEPALECRLSQWDDKPEEILCSEHARHAGYCRSCGIFWAGVTSFDMRGSGLCDHCQDQVNSDFYEPSDEDDYEGFEDHPYCNHCSNTGMVNCFCGGDLCVCDNHGEMPCPVCGD